MSAAFLTVRTAAARACISPGLVRGWVRDGLLPHLRVAGKVGRGKILIDPADLDNLLASFKVAANAPPSPTEAPGHSHAEAPQCQSLSLRPVGGPEVEPC